MTISIRPATLLDLPAIRGLWQQLADESAGKIDYPILTADTPVEVLSSLARAITVPIPTVGTFVADTGAAVVGFACAEACSRLIGEPKTYILGHFLIVDAAYRKQGLGKALINVLLDWCSQFPTEYAELSTYTHDDDWLRRGWQRSSTTYYTRLADVAATLAGVERNPTDVSLEPSRVE